MSKTTQKIATGIIKNKKKHINFKEILKEADSEKEFTREDTIRFLRKMIKPLLKQNFTNILTDEIVQSLEEYIEGNMALFLSGITFEDLVAPVTNAKSIKPEHSTFDYVKAEEAIIELINKSKTASVTFAEIKKHLETIGVNIDTNKWAFLRNKHMPNSDLGKLYKIKLVDGTSRKSSKWTLVKIKANK